MNQPPQVPPTPQLQNQQSIEQLTAAVGALINPLAQHQAATQQHAITADLEKYRLGVSAGNQSRKYSFTFAMTFLLIGGAVVGGLMVVGKHELAVNVMYFAIGAIGGFATGRSRQQQRQ